ncbi:MAG: peptidylprolyl isomerase [Candidatus Moranbacteria bacterium RBG_13_45_13]|nr:MAG: peptidylprolyl isomerase [Candidatus Moranbacteria bacterium RBG_13_45_13]
MQIDQNKIYSAVLKTSEGDITIELDAKKTPKTVNNFVSLARDNFYNGTIFHRVVKDFMIQGGDPNGDGSGGPGYKFEDENMEGEYTRGTVAMANSGPNTNGSQFFIIHKDYDLPQNYVVFGHVSSGMETVDKIAEAETTMSSSMEKSKPVSPVKIESVEVAEK